MKAERSGGAGCRSLQGGYLEAAQRASPQNVDRNAAPDALTIQQPDQIVHAGDGRTVSPHDRVQTHQTRQGSRPIRLERVDCCPRTIFDLSRTSMAPWHRGRLSGHAYIGAANTAMLNQLA